MSDVIAQAIANILKDYKADKLTLAHAVDEIKQLMEMCYG